MQNSNVVAYINSPEITVKLPLSAINQLSGNACKIYSLMRFRTVLSIDGKQYYNYKKGFYYIIYPNSELMKLTNIKKSSFYKAIKELKDKGWIEKISTKRQSVIRLLKAEPYYKPRYKLPSLKGLIYGLASLYFKVPSLHIKLQGLYIRPRNRTNINNQDYKQNNNTIYMNNAENKFSDVIEKTHKQLGLIVNGLKTISGFSSSYKEYSNIINKLMTVTNYKSNKKLISLKNKGTYINKKFLNFRTSPYFNSKDFVSDLNNIFGQIDYNTKNNNKTPNRFKYEGYLVSTLTNCMITYLKDNYYIKFNNRKRQSRKPHESKKVKHDKKIIKKYDNEDKHMNPTDPKEVIKINKQLGKPIYSGLTDKQIQQVKRSNEKSSKPNNKKSNKNTKPAAKSGTDGKNNGNQSKPSSIETKIKDLKRKIDDVEPISDESIELTHELNKAIAKKFIKDHHITKDEDEDMSITLLPNLKVLIKNVRDQAKNGDKNYCYSPEQIESFKKEDQREKQPVATDGSDVSDDDLPF